MSLFSLVPLRAPLMGTSAALSPDYGEAGGAEEGKARGVRPDTRLERARPAGLPPAQPAEAGGL